MREVVKAGYDDAALIDSNGNLSEGTIWNLAFWDGEAVVWPDAHIVPGVTMGILHRQLKQLGIHQRQEVITVRNLGRFGGAAVMNSWTPCVSVEMIGSQRIPPSNEFAEILRHAYESEPAVAF